jgi:hypothetical protein
MDIYRRLSVALVAGTLLIPAIAVAQEKNTAPPAADRQGDEQNDQEAQQGEDPPARVGRLGYIEGDVSQYGEGADDWAKAELNFPVTSNSAFATGANGRAEFELGSAQVRIDQGSELDVVTLDGHNTAVRLPQGAASFYLPEGEQGEEITTIVTTPRGDIALSAPGQYFITAGTQDEPTGITVVEGQAQITDAASATFNVAVNQLGVLTGDTNHPTFATRTPQPRPFQTWVQGREKGMVAVALPAQVSPHITGVRALGSYGSWTTEAQYGPVWMPRGVKADWEPYREGRWSYVRPWGWTWVDREPWGFAPFHYGRWVRIRNVWAWAPGVAVAQPGVALVARPVYAPALVVFAGIGGVAAKVGAPGPAVAWYPLGWNEPYIPPYRVSRTYIERVNIRVVERTRIVEVTRVYNRLYVRGGDFHPYQEFHVGMYRDRAIAVPRAAFVGARPVGQVVFRPNSRELRPLVRPADVRPPPMRVRPALRNGEPPRATILPVAKRAPIPQRLLAPKAAPLPRPQPAIITKGPQPENRPARPGEAKPENRPGGNHPEARPAPRPNPAKPEHANPPPPPNHPQARPENRPAPAKPEHANPPPPPNHSQARPENRPGRPSETKPENRPGMNHPEARPTPAKPERANPPPPNRPQARPENRPAPPKPDHANPPPPNRPQARPENRPGPAKPEHANPPPPNRPQARPENRPAPARPEHANPPPPNRPQARPENRPAPAKPENRPGASRPDNRPGQAKPDNANRPVPSRPGNQPNQNNQQNQKKPDSQNRPGQQQRQNPQNQQNQQ